MSFLKLTCEACNYSVLGYKFCPSCGLEVELVISPTTCPKCQTPRAINNHFTNPLNYTRFCGNCRFDFEEGVA